MQNELTSQQIVGGPSRFRLWLDCITGSPTVFRVRQVLPKMVFGSYTKTHVLVTRYVSLDGRPDMVSFTCSRLFQNGQVTVSWGVYNTRMRCGQMWILPVDDEYTTYYGSPQFRERAKGRLEVVPT